MSLSCCTVRVIVFRHLIVVSCTQGRLVPCSCTTDQVNHRIIQHQINPMRQIQEGITLFVAVSMRRDLGVSVAKERRTSDSLHTLAQVIMCCFLPTVLAYKLVSPVRVQLSVTVAAWSQKAVWFFWLNMVGERCSKSVRRIRLPHVLGKGHVKAGVGCKKGHGRTLEVVFVLEHTWTQAAHSRLVIEGWNGGLAHVSHALFEPSERGNCANSCVSTSLNNY